MKRDWEYKPSFPHLNDTPELREWMEVRRRHRHVRYLLFRLQNQVISGRPLSGAPDMPPGFVTFWLGEKPRYAMDPKGKPTIVPSNRDKFIADLGGYASFAKVWDVDRDLVAYVRHRSVWHEWNTILMAKVPVLGEYDS